MPRKKDSKNRSYRTIDKQKFYLVQKMIQSKARASNLAEFLRNEGHNARIIKNPKIFKIRGKKLEVIGKRKIERWDIFSTVPPSESRKILKGK